MTRAIIVDLDGTLADCRHRHALIENSDPSDPVTWRRHSVACVDDPPIPGVVKMVQLLARDHHVVILSGRTDFARSETEKWLRLNEVPFDTLILRSEGDPTSNGSLKVKEIERLRSEGFVFDLAIEDYHKAADAIAALGIPVLLVHSFTGSHKDSPLPVPRLRQGVGA